MSLRSSLWGTGPDSSTTPSTWPGEASSRHFAQSSSESSVLQNCRLRLFIYTSLETGCDEKTGAVDPENVFDHIMALNDFLLFPPTGADMCKCGRRQVDGVL